MASPVAEPRPIVPEKRDKPTLGGWLMRKLFVSPFKLMWRFTTRVERRIGIFFTLLSGAMFTIVGWWLVTSVVGFIIGFPMLVLGLMLVLRALY